jgi:uncharacterized repeat protein (TIGR03803 family)
MKASIDLSCFRFSRCLRICGTAVVVLIAAFLFAFAPGTLSAQAKFTTLHQFTGGASGTHPAGLIFDKAGNLYGTAQGGQYNAGLVFKLRPNPDGSWTETVIHAFTGADGILPGNLTFDKAGNLYGTAGGVHGTYGPGLVFKLRPNQDGTWTKSVLHSFSSEPNSLVVDQAGNLYGTTEFGGDLDAGCPGGCGLVFKLTPNASGDWTETVIHTFGVTSESGPGHLIFDAAGDLYGTVDNALSEGGGCGVFALRASSEGTWTERVLWSFEGGRFWGGLALTPPAIFTALWPVPHPMAIGRSS